MKSTDDNRQPDPPGSVISVPRAARPIAGRRDCADQAEHLLHILSDLTPVERQVWTLLGHDLGNLEIANRMATSVLAARVLVCNVLARLDVHSRAEAAALARQCGLVKPPAPGAEQRSPHPVPETEIDHHA